MPWLVDGPIPLFGLMSIFYGVQSCLNRVLDVWTRLNKNRECVCLCSLPDSAHQYLTQSAEDSAHPPPDSLEGFFPWFRGGGRERVILGRGSQKLNMEPKIIVV